MRNIMLIPSATCNLNCTYCPFEKNRALNEADKLIEESFSDNGEQYMQKMITNIRKHKFRHIGLWGAEPFLYIERIFPLLHKIIDYYPYFDEIYSSTNFEFSNWNDKVFSLFAQLGQYPDRDFNINLQLSCDGPEYINDLGRGKGTTKKCLNNFNIFVERLKTELPDNIILEITFNLVLDLPRFKKLNTKEAIIEYYLFFEDNFIRPLKELNKIKPNIICERLATPSCALPSPTTVEDGIFFANFCKMTREIEKENIKYNYFKYYEIITPYTGGDPERPIPLKVDYDNLTYHSPTGYCGIGNYLRILMPKGLNAVCNLSFVDLSDEYRFLADKSISEKTSELIVYNKYIKQKNNKSLLTDEEWDKFCHEMSFYTQQKSTSSLAILTTQIVILALAGQIDKKYINHKEALRAALFIRKYTVFCIKDNYNILGTITMQDYGMIKLFLNGAINYLF